MLQGQYKSPAHEQHMWIYSRSYLLKRHPVLTPVLLLSSSVVLGVASFFNISVVFPILAFTGISSILLCLSITTVLGIAGVLTGIIGMIESFDRYHPRAATFSKPKEHSYANRD
jgi:hypothetical protein